MPAGMNRYSLPPPTYEAPQVLTRHPKGLLKIFQANVGRAPDANDAALQLARDAGAAVILLQEPWFDREETRTKTHPAYRVYRPQTPERPRVLTFIHKNLRGYTTGGSIGTDLLRVFLSNKGITVVNIYRPPNEGSRGRTHIDLLATSILGRAVVIGDFNAISLI